MSILRVLGSVMVVSGVSIATFGFKAVALYFLHLPVPMQAEINLIVILAVVVLIFGGLYLVLGSKYQGQ